MSGCGNDHDGPCHWVNFQFNPPEGEGDKSTLKVWTELATITLQWEPTFEGKNEVADLISDLPQVVTEAALTAQAEEMVENVEDMLKGETDER